MILPNDILIRATSDGQTVWVSQRMVCEACGVDDEFLRMTARKRYKSSLPPSWRKLTDQAEFFLGDKPGKAWRWGRKGGQYYYDYDHIPNRKPTCYRDQLPTKEELIAAVEGQNLRGNRERQTEQRRMIREQVQQCANASDFRFFTTYAIGDKSLFDQTRARDLASSAAWCRFLKYTLATGGHIGLGFTSQSEFLAVCADLIASERTEGLRIKSAESLRKKIAGLPDGEAMLAALVSGKYCNDNRRIIGKAEIVDYATGEVMKYDAHQATIMSYWLNPGRSQKDSKQTLYGLYAYDMECLNIKPVKLSTFTHYINKWDNRYFSAAERHGKAYAKNAFRPYVPSQPLEFANSLWVSDGSGVVPYRYQDQYGKWRMMKMYTMLITDVGSRYMVGYSVSRKGQHIEDFRMLRDAMRMALLDNGKTEVMDFLSDNHGAYTGAESQAYLSLACAQHRTIAPHDSQANPAECIFRLFKRHFKSYFNLPETSWNAKSLESMANPDYYDIMALPTFSEAQELLDNAIREWNTSLLKCGMPPEQWFREFKNPAAGQYDARRYRMVTGEVSKRDISYARSILEVERQGVKYKYDIPNDATTVAMIAKHMGYAPNLTVTAYWDAEGADLYTPGGVYMFTCAPAPLASKTYAEATPEGLRALGHHIQKGETYDAITEKFVEDVTRAKAMLSPNYEFNVQDSGTKEDYNALRERIMNSEYNRTLIQVQTKARKATERQEKKVTKALEDAALARAKSKISDLSKYTK